MGAIIRTDDYGLVFTLPVEYAYADFGKLWYAEYNSTASASGASVTVFIETGAAYAITVNSKAAGNYISVSYTWNETAA